MDPWRVFITPVAEDMLKSLPMRVKNFVYQEFPPLIRENLFVGHQLSGPLSWLRSFHFSSDGNQYRIAYEIDQKARKIIIHYADPRGGFYERLRRLIRR